MEEKILINKYEVIKELGRGGMAIVYLAFDRQLKRDVAIKMLHPHMKQGEHVIRFEREAVVLATLSHPNIVNIYEFFEFEGNYYIVYEYVDGQTLGAFLEKHLIKYPIIALMISYEIIEAIEYIHKNKIIHRDIKPDNIMISNTGVVKVMDFGIAKVLNNSTVTDAGALLGSPAYMSPEQVMGGEITYSSDIFSLGVLIYRLLTNKSPFASSSTASTLKNVLNSSWPTISHPLIDKGMQRILEFTLNKDPKKRIKDLTSLKLILKDKIENEGKSAPFQEELADFFKSPEEYQINLKKELLEYYKEYSYKLYKEKNILKSLNYCGKALELGPKDPQLKILSNKLKIFNNGKRLRILVSFFVILTLMLIAFFNIISIKQSKSSYKYNLNAFDLTYLTMLKAKSNMGEYLAIDDEYGNQILNLKNKSIIKKSRIKKDSKAKKGGRSNATTVTDVALLHPLDKKDKKKGSEAKGSEAKGSEAKGGRSNATTVTDVALLHPLDKKDNKKGKEAKGGGSNATTITDVALLHPLDKKDKEEVKEFGNLSYCFRPYAKVYIDDKLYPESCLNSEISLAYGKHTVVAKYPYSKDYVENINVDNEHKNISIRYNFNHFSKIYLNLKSIAPISVSIKNEYGEYIEVKKKN
jgi:serine/threonine protein kinase